MCPIAQVGLVLHPNLELVAEVLPVRESGPIQSPGVLASIGTGVAALEYGNAKWYQLAGEHSCRHVGLGPLIGALLSSSCSRTSVPAPVPPHFASIGVTDANRLVVVSVPAHVTLTLPYVPSSGDIWQLASGGSGFQLKDPLHSSQREQVGISESRSSISRCSRLRQFRSSSTMARAGLWRTQCGSSKYDSAVCNRSPDLSGASAK